MLFSSFFVSPDIREDTHRTSENAWDLNSAVATKLKRRIFELLGVRYEIASTGD